MAAASPCAHPPMAAESHSGCRNSLTTLPLTGTQMKWEHSTTRICHHWDPEQEAKRAV